MFKRGLSPLFRKSFPFPILISLGKGIKGIGFLKVSWYLLAKGFQLLNITTLHNVRNNYLKLITLELFLKKGLLR
jgi:hypothetical protein